MKRLLVIVAALACVAIAAILMLPPDPYAAHFESPLPAGSQLLHYERFRAGFDVSYAFVFQVADDALLDQLVEEWALKPSVDDDHETTSFVALQPPSWWPTVQELAEIPVQYKWIDEDNERYRGVWLDRDKGRLYAECGRW